MKVEKPQELAKLLKEKKGVLLLTGQMCEEIDFNGRQLLDIAAELATALDLPVAATGNTLKGLLGKGITRTQKMWAAEVVEFMRSGWRDPLMPQRPTTLIFLGYSPGVARQLLSAVQGAETVVLGPSFVEEATYSIPDVSLKGWQQYLDALVQAVKG